MIFDPKELRDVFEDLAQRHGGNVQAARAQADKISGRFLVKVGNIHDYVVKLKDDKASTIRRYLVSEAFGPAGYNLAPTLDKLEVDGREAVREIPYLAYGDIEDQFAPDILGNAAKVISGHRPTSKIDGTFSIREANGQRIIAQHTTFGMRTHILKRPSLTLRHLGAFRPFKGAPH